MFEIQNDLFWGGGGVSSSSSSGMHIGAVGVVVSEFITELSSLVLTAVAGTNPMISTTRLEGSVPRQTSYSIQKTIGHQNGLCMSCRNVSVSDSGFVDRMLSHPGFRLHIQERYCRCDPVHLENLKTISITNWRQNRMHIIEIPF